MPTKKKGAPSPGSGGARPGAGAPRGPRKSTIEKALIAEATSLKAQVNGKRLAKDVLEEFMFLFGGMAAYYQPLPPGQPIPVDRKPDEAAFERWARLTVETAHKLAPFQSPTFKAVLVQSGPPLGHGDKAKQLEGKVVKLDQVSITRVYREIVTGGRP